MVRPKKLIGKDQNIKCASCGKEYQEGFKVTITIQPAEVTENFFIVYDSDIEEYDAYFCGHGCIQKYIQEVLHVPNNGRAA